MSKKKSLPPRRKRMKKEQRLLNAKTKWLPTTTAKDIAQSYSKWYGVDLFCAIRELESIGHHFTDTYKQQVATAHEEKLKRRQIRQEENQIEVQLESDNDSEFYFIAGYTENGIPFGLRYEDEHQ